MSASATSDKFVYRFTYFILVTAVLLYFMRNSLGIELADDGAFFLRYAENMLHGQFWVWNLGEKPVWGASDPLYPLLIAMVMKIGVSPVIAIEYSGMVMSAVAIALVAVSLARRVGIVSGVVLPMLAAFDAWVMYYSGAGLETPLTILLLAAGVWSLLEDSGELVVGIVAGLLCVNKLDLIPAGALLLVAQGFRWGRTPRLAIKVMVIIAAVWYGFAWAYFGAPVPNSFLTKALHQGAQQFSIDWTWFGRFVLLSGFHSWLVGFSLIAVYKGRKKYLPLFIFLGGILFVDLVAYTWKYPFEPYNWYCMPAVFSLLIMGAIGVQVAGEILGKYIDNCSQVIRYVFPVMIVGLIFSLYYHAEVKTKADIQSFTSNQEYDRSEAGRWVAKNTPRAFKVFTEWGNPSYYSQRYVLDGSFLNRKYENEDLIKKYRPEIIIMQNNPGSSPGAPVFAFNIDGGYTVVKVFDKTYRAGMGYFFAVLVRDDVVNQVRNIDPPRDLMKYVSDSVLGDQFGVLKTIASNSLFVHPGATTATHFKFDLSSFAHVTGQPSAIIDVSIAGNVPAAAIARGACNIHISISSGGSLLGQAVVTVGHPYKLAVNASKDSLIDVTVDNNGNPDTDWTIFSVH